MIVQYHMINLLLAYLKGHLERYWPRHSGGAYALECRVPHIPFKWPQKPWAIIRPVALTINLLQTPAQLCETPQIHLFYHNSSYIIFLLQDQYSGGDSSRKPPIVETGRKVTFRAPRQDARESCRWRLPKRWRLPADNVISG